MKSQLYCGIMYMKGLGMEKADLLRAYIWLNVAASQGMKIAGTVLQQVADQLSDKQINTGKALSLQLKKKIGSTGNVH